MCASSIVVAEWPEAIQAVLPANRLEVRIEGEGGGRGVSLAGFGAWESKLARFREIEAFLAKNGWGGCALHRCQGRCVRAVVLGLHMRAISRRRVSQ